MHAAKMIHHTRRRWRQTLRQAAVVQPVVLPAVRLPVRKLRNSWPGCWTPGGLRGHSGSGRPPGPVSAVRPWMPWLDGIGISAPSEARRKVRKLRRPTGARRELHGSARRTQDSSQRRESATNPDSKRAGANEKISGGKNAIVSPRATKRAVESAGNGSGNQEQSGLGISQLGLFPSVQKS